MNSSLRNALCLLEKGRFLVHESKGANYRLIENSFKLRERLIACYLKDLAPINTEAESLPCAVGIARKVFESDGRPQTLSVVCSPKARQPAEYHFNFSNNSGSTDSDTKLSTLSFTEKSQQHLTTYSFITEGEKWKFPYQDFIRSRRKWWKQLHFNRSSVEFSQEDATSEKPKTAMSTVFEDQDYNLASGIPLESSAVIGVERGMRIIESKCYIDRGCVALLLDAVRKRLFLESTRLAIHSGLAPIQTNIVIAEENVSKDLSDLKRYLILLLRGKNILVDDKVNNYAHADLIGVPFVIVLNNKSLENGVVLLRDRETAWFEEIHVYHVVARMVNIYQHRELEAEEMPLKAKKAKSSKPRKRIKVE